MLSVVTRAINDFRLGTNQKSVTQAGVGKTYSNLVTGDPRTARVTPFYHPSDRASMAQDGTSLPLEAIAARVARCVAYSLVAVDASANSERDYRSPSGTRVMDIADAFFFASASGLLMTRPMSRIAALNVGLPSRNCSGFSSGVLEGATSGLKCPSSVDTPLYRLNSSDSSSLSFCSLSHSRQA